MSYPKKSKAFGQWAKLMQEQAVVPDRVDYKKAVKGGTKRSKRRRKRFRSRKRRASE